MAAPTVNPSTHAVLVGLTAAEAITGLLRETQADGSTADIEEVRGEDNATAAEIVSNPGVTKTFTATVLSTYTAPAKGTVVTINSIKYMVDDATVTKSRTVARLSLTVHKAGSITYS